MTPLAKKVADRAKAARSGPPAKETYSVKHNGISKRLPSFEAAVQLASEKMAQEPTSSEITIHKFVGLDETKYWLLTIKEMKQLIY